VPAGSAVRPTVTACNLLTIRLRIIEKPVRHNIHAKLEADIDPGALLGIATTARKVAVLVVTNGHTPRIALEHFKIAG
tara:strand:- start:20 stop:253 length:234 start_codon:yes stop_codon:yes gene_type:complete